MMLTCALSARLLFCLAARHGTYTSGVTRPTPLLLDSRAAIDLSEDPVAFKKTKHILRAAEFLRALVAREVTSLVHVPGKFMLADLLTKAPGRVIFLELVRLLDDYSRSGVATPSL